MESLVQSPSGRQVAVFCQDHSRVFLYDVTTGSLQAVLGGLAPLLVAVTERRTPDDIDRLVEALTAR